MSVSIVAGFAVGLGTVLISELLLRWWKRRPEVSPWTVALIGLALRTAWTLAALIAGMASGWLRPEPFIAALVVTYLTAQAYEGFRYQRFIRKR